MSFYFILLQSGCLRADGAESVRTRHPGGRSSLQVERRVANYLRGVYFAFRPTRCWLNEMAPLARVFTRVGQAGRQAGRQAVDCRLFTRLARL